MFPHQIYPEISGSNVIRVRQIRAQHCFLIPFLQTDDTEYAADDKISEKVKFKKVFKN